VYFVQLEFGCLWTFAYRDKAVGVFVRFRTPLGALVQVIDNGKAWA
jgi:hypothetical protein